MNNNGKGREKFIGGSAKINKRGNGLNLGGPVGTTNHPKSAGKAITRGGAPSLLMIILALAYFFLGGNGQSTTNTVTIPQVSTNNYYQTTQTTSTTSWVTDSNNKVLNLKVEKGSRDKFANTVTNSSTTLMIYMCGTDLESKNGMATADLLEIANADISDNLNIILYTGGCKSWNNSIISSRNNEIYQIKKGGLLKLKTLYPASMTDEKTLREFISYCDQNYPSERNILIMWDHGGGSTGGYGYDENYATSGSMKLPNIAEALKKANVDFDIIGFDACLMATYETALLASDHADYLIASEELEPGTGWYYTNWINELSNNPNINSVELGKIICDDFVETSMAKDRGSNATLSVVDLAELSNTAPKALENFSKDTVNLINNNQYATVSQARSNAKEFAKSSKIDQTDLVNLAINIGTEQTCKLADVIKNAVKYNRVANGVTDAYGLSIYFPYRLLSSVDKMVNTYDKIGLNNTYSTLIKNYAALSVTGQAAAGGTQSYNSYSSQNNSSQDIYNLMYSLLNDSYSGILGLDRNNTAFLENQDLTSLVSYVSDNRFNPDLRFTYSDGQKVLRLSEKEWKLVNELVLNVFYDDGEGLIDLGLDNIYEFNKQGELLIDYDQSWLAVNGQLVAYYYLDTQIEGDNFKISGYIPAMVNGTRAELMVLFTNEKPQGYINDVRYIYLNNETDTQAKTSGKLNNGDKIDFICDYYSNTGEFINNYYLGDALIVNGELTLSNVYIEGGNLEAAYRLTDIYGEQHWTADFAK